MNTINGVPFFKDTRDFESQLENDLKLAASLKLKHRQFIVGGSSYSIEDGSIVRADRSDSILERFLSAVSEFFTNRVVDDDHSNGLIERITQTRSQRLTKVFKHSVAALQWGAQEDMNKICADMSINNNQFGAVEGRTKDDRAKTLRAIQGLQQKYQEAKQHFNWVMQVFPQKS